MKEKVAVALFRLKRLAAVLGKYKIVIVVVVVVLTGLLIWQHARASTNDTWKKATDAYRHADYQTAAKLLKNQKAPSDSDRLAIYAQTMLATRQLDKAADAYQKLYDQKKDPNAKLILGNVYNQQKKYDEAAKIYNELIASNPNFAQAYVNLATLYKIQGKNDQAITVSKKAVTNNPTNTVLNELLVSMTMSQPNSSDYKTAVANLQKLNPKDPLLASLSQQ